MNIAPLLPVLDHLWQSTLFAAAAGLLTLAMRKNRARVRHGLWLAASVKFLVPFSVLIVAGSHVHWPKAQRAAASNWSAVAAGVSEPFTAPMAAVTPSAPSRPAANQLPAVLLGIWACGFLGIACSWAVRWRRLAAVVRAGSPVDLDLPIPAMASPTLVEPGVFGVFQPVLLLPAGIFERLTPAQLNSVITHELHHVRHRDNLIGALHMFVETVFWFHPLVWWIGKRMVEERERACDEGVLSAGNEPRVYAEAVLNVCKLYVESPLTCVSGITGANLKRRIEAIMTGRVGGDLHVVKKLGLAFAGMAALVAPILIGMLHSQPAKAQSAPAAVAEPVSRTVAAPAIPAPAAHDQAAQAQSNSAAASEEARKLRAANTRIDFTNTAMFAAYTQYGFPNQIEFRNTGTKNPTQIWRYKYLEAYHSNVEFEFAPKVSLGARINWPPQKTFEGQDPGRHGSIQPSIPLSSSTQLVNFALPLDTLSGSVDIIGRIVQIESDSSTDGPVVANIRDSVQAAQDTNLTYRATFILSPGSYVCRVLAREQATGRMFTDWIAFQLP